MDWQICSQIDSHFAYRNRFAFSHASNRQQLSLLTINH